MRSKRVKMLCVAMWVLIMCALPLGAYASEHKVQEVGLEPFWGNSASISAFLHIDSSGRASVSGTVVGNPGTTSITVNATLVEVHANGATSQVREWNNISTNERVWTWDASLFVARGREYRLTLTATVVNNGVSETVTHSSTARS